MSHLIVGSCATGLCTQPEMFYNAPKAVPKIIDISKTLQCYFYERPAKKVSRSKILIPS